MEYSVVIVDDEISIPHTLKEFFPWNECGFFVREVFDRAGAALEYLAVNPTDLVITDIKMPMLDGIAFAEAIQRRKIASEVIILSGFAEFGYAQEALRLGVREYLLKPIDYTQLRLCLARIKEGLDEKNHIPVIEARSKGYYAQIAGVITDYLEKNYAKATLDEASCLVAMSPNYLSKVFKTETGENFSDCLIKTKMKNAERLLKDVNLKIYEIAYAVGYDNPKNFTRAFKQYTGLSPWEYRERGPHAD